MPVAHEEISKLELNKLFLDLGLSSAPQGKNFSYFVIFAVLLAAMNVRQKTVVVQAKEIELNAQLQNKFNEEESKIKFKVAPPPLPSGASKKAQKKRQQEIKHDQEENQKAGIERSDIENFLITARQMGQTDMTQASTSVNVVQQDASEDAGWLRTLNTIFKVINQMTQRMR